MAYSSKFSKEEVKKIGNRLYSARVLTGMSREEFGEKQQISVMTIKNWELGRVMPRLDGIMSLINAFKECSVYVSTEWVLYGSGVGPNFIETNTHEKDESSNSLLLQQIDLFKRTQRALGLNPIVITVQDNSMEPNFIEGDIVGAVFISYDFFREKNKISSVRNKWLITDPNGLVVPAFIYSEGNRWLMNTIHNPDLIECQNPSIAIVRWHYSSGEQI